MQSDDVNAGELLPVFDDADHILLIHAKLATGGQSNQDGNSPSTLACTVVDERQMQRTFCCEDAHLVIHGPFHICAGLVHAGKNYLAHISADPFADGQFAGAANLDPLEGVRQTGEQKGVGFDREAEADFLTECLFYLSDPMMELVNIKDVGRCVYQPGQFLGQNTVHISHH